MITNDEDLLEVDGPENKCSQLLERGDFTAAVAMVEKLKRKDRMACYQQLVDYCLKNNDPTKALEIANLSTHYDRSSIRESHKSIVTYHLTKMNFDAALATIKTLKKKHRTSFYKQLVDYCLENNDPEKALETAKLDIASSVSPHCRKIIEYHLAKMDLDAALLVVGELEQRYRTDCCELLITYCLKSNNPIKALEIAKLDASFTLSGHYTKIVDYYLENNAPERALKIIESSNNPNMLVCCGKVITYYLSKMNFSAALLIFESLEQEYRRSCCELLIAYCLENNNPTKALEIAKLDISSSVSWHCMKIIEYHLAKMDLVAALLVVGELERGYRTNCYKLLITYCLQNNDPKKALEIAKLDMSSSLSDHCRKIIEYYLAKMDLDAALFVVGELERGYRTNCCELLITYCLQNNNPMKALEIAKLDISSSLSIHCRKIIEYHLTKMDLDAALLVVGELEQRYRMDFCKLLITHCLQNNDPKKALEIAKLDISSSLSIHCRKIIEYHLTKMDLDAAISILGKLESDSFEMCYLQVIEHCLEKNDLIKALETVNLAVSNSISIPRCYQKLFKYYLMNSQLAKAIEIFNSKELADNEKCLDMLFNYYLSTDDISNAEKTFAQIFSNPSSESHADKFINILSWYIKNGELNTILTAYNKKSQKRALSSNDSIYKQEKYNTEIFEVPEKNAHVVREKFDQERSTEWLCEMFNVLNRNKGGTIKVEMLTPLSVKINIIEEVEKYPRDTYAPKKRASSSAGEYVAKGAKRLFRFFVGEQPHNLTQSINVTGANNNVTATQRVVNTNGLGLGIFGAGAVGSAAYLYNEHLDRQTTITANNVLASRIPLAQPEEEEQEEEETNLHEIFNSYRDF